MKSNPEYLLELAFWVGLGSLVMLALYLYR